MFVQEKNLQKIMLAENPMPPNLGDKEDVEFNFLKKKIRKYLLTQDSIYEKVQKKNVVIMGPLGKLWHALEQENKWGKSSTYSLEALLNFVGHTVLLVGQNSKTFLYLKYSGWCNEKHHTSKIIA